MQVCLTLWRMKSCPHQRGRIGALEVEECKLSRGSWNRFLTGGCGRMHTPEARPWGSVWRRVRYMSFTTAGWKIPPQCSLGYSTFATAVSDTELLLPAGEGQEAGRRGQGKCRSNRQLNRRLLGLKIQSSQTNVTRWAFANQEIQESKAATRLITVPSYDETACLPLGGAKP